MKTDLCFQKWHEEFSKFSSEHVWSSEKLVALKTNAKFEEKFSKIT